MRLACVIVVAACGSGGGFPDAPGPDSPPPVGAFSVAWTVTDTGGTPIACDRIGAQTMTVTYHNRAFEGALTEVFNCTTGMGTGTGLIAGQYDFMFELDTTTTTLATAPQQIAVDIPADTTTPLQPLTFAVDATGAIALTLQTNKSGGNCAPAVMMGGAITSTTITLEHDPSMVCEPITLQISAGATSGRPAGSYTINCAAPTIGPCIETDQTLSATNVPSDAYRIHVRGNVGAAACWQNDDQLQVPAQSMTLTRTLNLGYATSMPGC